MKKFFALSIVMLGMIMGQSANAQGLGSLLNKAVGAVTNATGDSQAGNVISDLISKYTGDLTTTEDALIGTWSYADPKVQFESENLLAEAGGSSIASKVENKLSIAFKTIGMGPGKLKFTFAKEGKVSYSFSGRQYEGTYTFDSKNKTVSLEIPKIKKSLTAYVTISGNKMSLCFDSSKAMTLFTNLASNFSDKVASIAGNYNGMKTGFQFTKE